MKKFIALTGLLFAFVTPVSHAELLNDASCTLNKGYTLTQLFAIQKKWMAAAKAHGFDESEYTSQIYLPVYTEATSTTPMVILWRGQFKNGEVLGRNFAWFQTTDWSQKFSQVINCSKTSLWIAPQ